MIKSTGSAVKLFVLECWFCNVLAEWPWGKLFNLSVIIYKTGSNAKLHHTVIVRVNQLRHRKYLKSYQAHRKIFTIINYYIIIIIIIPPPSSFLILQVLKI